MSEPNDARHQKQENLEFEFNIFLLLGHVNDRGESAGATSVDEARHHRSLFDHFSL